MKLKVAKTRFARRILLLAFNSAFIAVNYTKFESRFNKKSKAAHLYRGFQRNPLFVIICLC